MDLGKNSLLARIVEPIVVITSQPAQRAELQEANHRVRPLRQTHLEAAARAQAEPDNVEERDGVEPAAVGAAAEGEDASVIMSDTDVIMSDTEQE